jgi:hypothetical protein
MTRREVDGLLVFVVLSIVPASERDSKGKREETRKDEKREKGYELCGFLFIERALWVLNQGGQGLNVALVKGF